MQQFQPVAPTGNVSAMAFFFGNIVVPAGNGLLVIVTVNGSGNGAPAGGGVA